MLFRSIPGDAVVTVFGKIDGRDVAVKVQYPGVHEAIESDLDAAEVMYAMFSSMMLKGLDAKGLVDELRDRMREELDYSIEAGNLAEFESRFQGHPWVRIPKLVPELSSGRVLTTEWIDGMTFDQFRTTESYATKQRAGEVIGTFQCINTRHGIFTPDDEQIAHGDFLDRPARFQDRQGTIEPLGVEHGFHCRFPCLTASRRSTRAPTGGASPPP